jgi:hypothetical protein
MPSMIFHSNIVLRQNAKAHLEVLMKEKDH